MKLSTYNTIALLFRVLSHSSYSNIFVRYMLTLIIGIGIIIITLGFLVELYIISKTLFNVVIIVYISTTLLLLIGSCYLYSKMKEFLSKLYYKETINVNTILDSIINGEVHDTEFLKLYRCNGNVVLSFLPLNNTIEHIKNRIKEQCNCNNSLHDYKQFKYVWLEKVLTFNTFSPSIYILWYVGIWFIILSIVLTKYQNPRDIPDIVSTMLLLYNILFPLIILGVFLIHLRSRYVLSILTEAKKFDLHDLLHYIKMEAIQDKKLYNLSVSKKDKSLYILSLLPETKIIKDIKQQLTE